MLKETLQQLPVRLLRCRAKQRFTLTIVFHPDLNRIGQQCRPETNSIEISRLFPLFGFAGEPLQPLSDPFVSRAPVLLSKQGDSWRLERKQSPIQLSDASHQLIERRDFTAQQLHQGVPVILAGRIVLLLHLSLDVSADSPDPMGLIGVSDNLVDVRNTISKVAPLHSPVLIRGESGTGKELVAKAIHQQSPRHQHKLVSVNVAAMPKELIATELFGSVKGAYTGAVDRKGCFQQADNSSLFLDEIGEASLEMQVSLLRALEAGVIQAVGSQHPQQVDVRVITATDADLQQLIGDELFRMPLLQRLAGLVIEILPLRQRAEDIGCLLSYFLQRRLADTAQENKLHAADQEGYCYWAWFFAFCCQLQWPGNIRQLQNVVTQLCVGLMGYKTVNQFDWLSFSDGLAHTAITALQSQASINEVSSIYTRGKRKPSEITDEEMLTALENNHWQIKLAAQALNISRAALYQKMDASELVRRVSDIPATEIERCYLDSRGDMEKMVNQLHVSKAALKRRLNEMGLN
ncbi:sigma 54-interacting transcriptional regulator [Bowmanella denitrificans]|uniref:sigma 54-interacting transcriptional regulator n=1 Tax=Bowmanella denitrificans TaxID=366582 RepID=UPI000C9B3364|nr:sigma 54-interacting transcriptional regulator [Bowmanella denitrificans]